MAAINFDMAAYTYSEGLKAIGMMFEAASGTLKQHGDEALKAIEEYWRHLENGGNAIGEWDGENKLWEQDDIHRLELLTVESALDELRAATTILIYHHWERTIPNPNQTRNRKQEQLMIDAEAYGVTTAPEISALHYAANYLKHGNPHWLVELFKHYPDRFTVAPQLGAYDAWHRQLKIEDHHIRWFLNIAADSNRPAIAFPQ